jgi:hypothetical protein
MHGCAKWIIYGSETTNPHAAEVSSITKFRDSSVILSKILRSKRL